MSEVIVNPGDWVLFRDNSAYRPIEVRVHRAAKVSPKLIKFEGTNWPRQCNRLSVTAAFPDEQTARQVAQAIDGVSGTFQQKRRNIEDDRSRRITEALAVANRSVERIVASAMSARSGETAGLAPKDEGVNHG